MSGIVESYPQGGQVGCKTYLKQTQTKWHLERNDRDDGQKLQ